MPPIFNIEKREQIKTDLLYNGAKMVLESGIRKFSIQRLTEATGIGKGTFYHFYDSKETYISELIHYGKEDMYEYMNQKLEENNYLDKQSFLEFFERFSWDHPTNLAMHLSDDDKDWIRTHLGQEFGVNTDNEHRIMSRLFDHNPNVKANIDYHVIFNMMRIMGTIPQMIHDVYPDALDRNYQLLYQSLADYIFK